MHQPTLKPARPLFSSGPCVKPLQWSPDVLNQDLLGRSHRSRIGLQKIRSILSRMRTLLGIPEGYQVALLPGGATGAMEGALWNFLGSRSVDVWVFDVFSTRWAEDIRDQLRIPGAHFWKAPAGQVPDFHQRKKTHDQVFNWCGTTAGVCLEGNEGFLDETREGLTLCDATSAIFSTILPWDLLDVTAFSWQKSLGGEGGHGMLVLSPRAIEHLRSYQPAWPIPRLFNLRNDSLIRKNQITGSLFQGYTFNTPSMLAIADVLWILEWVEQQGGVKGLIQRVEKNFETLDQWVRVTPWVEFLVQDSRYRSHAAVCLKIVDATFQKFSEKQKWQFLKVFCDFLEKESAVLDCLNHALSVPSLRFWCGPTVETEDVQRALPWFTWAFQETLKKLPDL